MRTIMFDFITLLVYSLDIGGMSHATYNTNKRS